VLIPELNYRSYQSAVKYNDFLLEKVANDLSPIIETPQASGISAFWFFLAGLASGFLLAHH